MFYGQYAIAGAFSGAIAYGVFQLNTTVLKPWQLLFVIEGVATCVIAAAAALWLPSGPGSAWFLNEDHRAFATERMRLDNAAHVRHSDHDHSVGKDRLTRRDVVETAKDWKLWFVLPFNILASVVGQALSVFLPLVVKELGYSSIRANLMAVPPFVCGAMVLYLFALSSDHRKERGFHILGGLLTSVVGLTVTVTASGHGMKYAGLCILLSGSFVSAPLTAAWLCSNTPEGGMRAMVLGGESLHKLELDRSFCLSRQPCRIRLSLGVDLLTTLCSSEWVWKPIRSHWVPTVPRSMHPNIERK